MGQEAHDFLLRESMPQINDASSGTDNANTENGDNADSGASPDGGNAAPDTRDQTGAGTSSGPARPRRRRASMFAVPPDQAPLPPPFG